MDIIEIMEEEAAKLGYVVEDRAEAEYIVNWVKRDLEEQAEEFAEFGKGRPSVEDVRKVIAKGMAECVNMFRNVNSGKGRAAISRAFGF